MKTNMLYEIMTLIAIICMATLPFIATYAIEGGELGGVLTTITVVLGIILGIGGFVAYFHVHEVLDYWKHRSTALQNRLETEEASNKLAYDDLLYVTFDIIDECIKLDSLSTVKDKSCEEKINKAVEILENRDADRSIRCNLAIIELTRTDGKNKPDINKS